MRTRTLIAVFAAAGFAFAFGTATPASAAVWAPASSAAITPGVMTYTAGSGQCTANFVFTDGVKTYLGQAAHCSGTGAATDTNGCDAGTLPLGTRVDVEGFQGTIVYSSWIAMQAAGENSADACAYNDFALIELPAAAVAATNPSVPVYGGPVALGAGTSTGQSVYSYGNSSLRFGLTPFSPKRGVSLGDSGLGWNTTVYTVTPGIPGDSGSGFLDASGRAFGTLSTVALAPFPASNGVSNLAKELAYARSHGVPGLSLVAGTEAFTPMALV